MLEQTYPIAGSLDVEPLATYLKGRNFREFRPQNCVLRWRNVYESSVWDEFRGRNFRESVKYLW